MNVFYTKLLNTICIKLQKYPIYRPSDNVELRLTNKIINRAKSLIFIIILLFWYFLTVFNYWSWMVNTTAIYVPRYNFSPFETVKNDTRWYIHVYYFSSLRSVEQLISIRIVNSAVLLPSFVVVICGLCSACIQLRKYQWYWRKWCRQGGRVSLPVEPRGEPCAALWEKYAISESSDPRRDIEIILTTNVYCDFTLTGTRFHTWSLYYHESYIVYNCSVDENIVIIIIIILTFITL